MTGAAADPRRARHAHPRGAAAGQRPCECFGEASALPVGGWVGEQWVGGWAGEWVGKWGTLSDMCMLVRVCVSHFLEY